MIEKSDFDEEALRRCPFILKTHNNYSYRYVAIYIIDTQQAAYPAHESCVTLIRLHKQLIDINML